MAITLSQSPQTTVYQLFIRGGVFNNTIAALREIADQAGFAYEKAWNTQHFGSKLVDFLNANPTQASASKSEPNKSHKQHVRVEVEMTEHDYAAFDSEEDMTDSFAFYSVEQIRIFVDGEDIEFDDWGFDGDTFTDYEPFDLKEKWDNDDIVKFGYYENKVETVWEFDVENFDIEKLRFVHQCFDVTYDPADYNCEEDWLTLHYDGQSLEDNIVASNTSDGDFQQEWSMYDDEDNCSSDFAEDEEEEEDVEARLNNKYDQVFQDGDIYSVNANGKWGFVDKDGKELIAPRYDWMGDEFVEGVIIVGYDGGGIGYANDEGVEIVAPKYEQACDFCNGFAAVRLNNKWGFVDKSGKEVVEVKYNDVENFMNGKAKVTLGDEEFEIDTQGNRIDSDDSAEDVTTLLSNVFGTLAWVVSDMDDNVTEEEIKAILGIASGFDEFDLDIVRQRIVLEKMGIRDYDSHTALAKSVPAKYREMMFHALTVVAVSDFKIKQSEVDLLGGLSEIWEIDWDTTANNIINSVIERLSESHPDGKVEIE